VITIIKPGNLTIIIQDQPGAVSPEQLYEWMECDVITTPRHMGFFIGGQLHQFCLDENGELTGKPINPLATDLYHDGLARDPRGERVGERNLFGNVVILTHKNILLAHRRTHIHSDLLRPKSAMLRS
jgi:hypothetical protein